MTALSVLDLMMVGEDKTFTDTLNDAVALARHVETHGYKRYWVAEHHDLPGSLPRQPPCSSSIWQRPPIHCAWAPEALCCPTTLR